MAGTVYERLAGFAAFLSERGESASCQQVRIAAEALRGQDYPRAADALRAAAAAAGPAAAAVCAPGLREIAGRLPGAALD